MDTLEDFETVVIAENDRATDRVPDWCAGFRLLYRHLKKTGRLDRLDELFDTERRADSYGLREIVLFLIAYFAANPSEGGLRQFWYQLREVQQKVAPMVGLQRFPSSSSVSRFLDEMTPKKVESFQRFIFDEGTDIAGLSGNKQTRWLDTLGDGWLMVDWDPKGRMIRQRTLVETSDHRPPKRYGPAMGAKGHAGRKRGELKVTTGLMGLAGSGLWVGGYTQPGNGTLVDRLDVVEQAHQALTGQLGESVDGRLVMRVDGEGGEASVINGIRQAGFVPLVRLKQYHFLERQDVLDRLETTEPQIAEGTGTGPRREVYEIGSIPLTSHREIDEVDRVDTPLRIRLVVSRYRRTEADQGAGKLIDGWRYEMFGTDLPVGRWPSDAVVDAYFGRATVENRFAGTNRELQIDRGFCQTNDAGQMLVILAGLWVWNLMVELGDRLVDSPKSPPQRRRDDNEEIEKSRRPASGSQQSHCPVSTNESPKKDSTLLSAPTRRRLEKLQMQYRPGLGVLICEQGHFLVPKRSKAANPKTVVFRVVGMACRGCPFRRKCTHSTNPNFRKEVVIQAEQVPAAVDIQQGRRPPPLGVIPQPGVDSGPHQVRRPVFLAARRRQAFKNAIQTMELRVDVERLVGAQSPDARCYNRHRRTRQRLPRDARRRYHRLGAGADIRICWDRGVDTVRLLAEDDP